MEKDKTTAAVFALLLGGVGAHYFYLGCVGWGVLSLLFCWTGIPSLIGLIQGIRYLLMTDEQFCAYFGLESKGVERYLPDSDDKWKAKKKSSSVQRDRSSLLLAAQEAAREEDDEDEESDDDEVMFKKLERLNQLHKSGALSDEEFDREKRRLLVR